MEVLRYNFAGEIYRKTCTAAVNEAGFFEAKQIHLKREEESYCIYVDKVNSFNDIG